MKNGKPTIGINMDCTIKKGKVWYRIPENYVKAIVDYGGIPRLFPIYYDAEFIEEQIDDCDGFLFMGGDDYPARYFGMKPDSHEGPMIKERVEFDITLANLILKTSKPVLGICAGAQLINIVNGGKLILNIDGHGDGLGKGKDVYHNVKIIEEGILKKLFGTDNFEINSGHHQSINPKFVSDNLKITAMSEDGIVEAIEGIEGRFLLGLQWHPERIKDLKQRKIIFDKFISECKK